MTVDSQAASDSPVDIRERAPSVRGRLLVALRILVVLGIIGGITYAAVTTWAEVKDAILSLEPLAVGVSFLLICAGIFAGVKVWHVVLYELGSEIPYRRAAQIALVGQLGKYLPGSVWAFVLQTELSRRVGIPRARAFTALLVSTGVTFVAALVLAPLALPWIERPWIRLAVMLGPLSLIALHPRVLAFLVGTALRLLRRPQPALQIRSSDVLRSLMWAYIAAILFGLSLWTLANSTATPGVSGIVRCIVGMSLAMTFGVLAFLAPSGLGVREAFIVAALSPTVSMGTALGYALVSRLLFIIADLVTAGAAVVRARLSLRNDAAAIDTDATIVS